MAPAEHQPEPQHAESPERPRRRRLSPGTRAAISSISGWTSTFLCIALVTAIIAGFGQMQAKASHINATRPEVRFDWPPLGGFQTSAPATPGGEPRTWINAEIRSDLEHAALSKLGADPFDRAALSAARDVIAATGWYRDDLKLVRGGDGIVQVRGTWRVPAAAVRSDGQDMLVSSIGELLPVKYRPDASGYKVIVGAAHAPPELGKPWLGGDVQAGLTLLSLVSAMPWSGQVAAVDVTEYSPGRSLVLVTDVGNRVLWGGPVEEFNPGQATPSVKLSRLGQLYREMGRIDAGRQVVDIRLMDGVYIHDTNNVLTRAEMLKQDLAGSAVASKTTPAAGGAKTKKSVSR